MNKILFEWVSKTLLQDQNFTIVYDGKHTLWLGHMDYLEISYESFILHNSKQMHTKPMKKY